MSEGNLPAISLKSGGVQLSAWEQTNADGDVWYQTKAEKRYYDKKTEVWKSTNYFNKGELLILAELSRQMWARLVALQAKQRDTAPEPKAEASGDVPF